MVEIIEYQDRYYNNFRQLNLEWLEAYHLAESHDFEVLDDPRKQIIDRGGYIFLAAMGGNIVGSAALAKTGDGIYELAKMSVAPALRGAGIGKILIEHCLQKAKQVNATKIILYSNSQLQPAIKMYEKYGFKHIAAIDSPFVTADVKMELSL
jgi:GNAT superfamily N-acetyltransferase